MLRGIWGQFNLPNTKPCQKTRFPVKKVQMHTYWIKENFRVRFKWMVDILHNLSNSPWVGTRCRVPPSHRWYSGQWTNQFQSVATWTGFRVIILQVLSRVGNLNRGCWSKPPKPRSESSLSLLIWSPRGAPTPEYLSLCELYWLLSIYQSFGCSSSVTTHLSGRHYVQFCCCSATIRAELAKATPPPQPMILAASFLQAFGSDDISLDEAPAQLCRNKDWCRVLMLHPHWFCGWLYTAVARQQLCLFIYLSHIYLTFHFPYKNPRWLTDINVKHTQSHIKLSEVVQISLPLL